MDSSTYYYIGVVVLLIAGVSIFQIIRSRRPRLPHNLPSFGPLPLAELAQFYPRKEQAIAWERVRGWRLNEPPAAWTAPAPIDHTVLTSRVLDFCSSGRGTLEIDFDFLVAAISQVDFDASAIPAGLAPEGYGVITIHTPSGRTVLIGSPEFAQTLQNAVSNARDE